MPFMLCFCRILQYLYRFKWSMSHISLSLKSLKMPLRSYRRCSGCRRVPVSGHLSQFKSRSISPSPKFRARRVRKARSDKIERVTRAKTPFFRSKSSSRRLKSLPKKCGMLTTTSMPTLSDYQGIALKED